MPAAAEPNVNQRPRFTVGTAPPAQVIPADVGVFRGGEPQDDVSVPALVGRIRRGEIPGLQTGLSQGGSTILPPPAATPGTLDPNLPLITPGGIGALLGKVPNIPYLGTVGTAVIAGALAICAKVPNIAQNLCRLVAFGRTAAKTAKQTTPKTEPAAQPGGASTGKTGVRVKTQAEAELGGVKAGTVMGMPQARTTTVRPGTAAISAAQRSSLNRLLGEIRRTGEVIRGTARAAGRPVRAARTADLPRVTEPKKTAVKAPPKPKTYCERHPIRCLTAATALVAGSKRLTTSRGAARTTPRTAAPVLPAPLPLVGELPTFGRPFIGGAALDPFPLSSLQTLTQAQRQRLPSATRTCLAQCERPRRTGKCREGFFKETRARTRFKVWREYDCLTGKVTRRSK